jgi:hypothetical protein
MKSKLSCISIFLWVAACTDQESITLVQSSLISGRITYVDEGTSIEKNLPKGTQVTVIFNAGTPYYGYSFKTTEDGVYSFKPQVKGNYDLVVSLDDTVVQFNADLVVAGQDQGPARKSESLLVAYKDSIRVSIDEKSKIISRDIKLQQTATNLKLTIKDEKGNPVRAARVCIYDNATFADTNSPYCGGSIAYLSSNGKGEVFFTGLSAKEYFVVARATVGNLTLNNKFAEATKSTGALTAKKTTTKDIVVK